MRKSAQYRALGYEMVLTKSLNTISQGSPGKKARTRRRKEDIRGYDRRIRRAKRERKAQN